MTLIEVKNLVKKYKIMEKEDGLIGYFKSLIKPKYKEFTAVKNINFKINEGELVGYIGKNGAGKSTTIKMLIELSIPITFFLILKIVVFSIIGAAITGAILTIFSISSFWTYKSNEVIWTFYRMHTFAQYPIDIYNGFIKILITVILPFAFVAYYPTMNYLGMNKYMNYLSPIIMVILWIIAVRVWNWALNKYRSTGS